MSSKNLVREEMLPHGWCPGCGLHNVFYTSCDVLNEIGKSVVVSGIGCSARGAAYFNLDTIHGIHGRAIPLAVGIKRVNPKLNVVVFSGDGDILAIGGNHFIHAARRNDDITIICNSNEVFAMTGRQVSPTTKIGGKTSTTPEGNDLYPINTQGILMSNEKYFYARTTPILKDHMKKCLKEAMKHKGFSFIEIISPCIINYEKYNKLSGLFNELKNNYKIIEENSMLKDNELGIVKK